MCIKTALGACLIMFSSLDGMTTINKDVRPGSIETAVPLEARQWQISLSGDQRLLQTRGAVSLLRNFNSLPYAALEVDADISDREIALSIIGERLVHGTSDHTDNMCFAELTVEAAAQGSNTSTSAITHTASSVKTSRMDYRADKEGSCTPSGRTISRLRTDAYNASVVDLMDSGKILDWYTPFGYITAIKGLEVKDNGAFQEHIVVRVDAGANLGVKLGDSVQFFSGPRAQNPYMTGHIVKTEDRYSYALLENPDEGSNLDFVMIGDTASIVRSPVH